MLGLSLLLAPAFAETPPVQAGRYVMVVEVGSESRVPVAGTAQITTRSLLRVDLKRGADGAWTQAQRLCAIDVASDTRATTVLPQAFIDAVPEKRFAIRLTREKGAWVYRADPGPNYIGYDPALSNGLVPQKRNDPGVVDFEGDGYPGATMLLQVPVLGSVRMYIAQKGWSVFDGVVRDGTIEGRVQSLASDSRTLGASVGLFATNATITPVPERSRFRLVPVRDDATCADLASSWTRTFDAPEFPPQQASAGAAVR